MPISPGSPSVNPAADSVLALIVSYNGAEPIADLLRSCLPPEVPALLIDNASSDNTLDIVRGLALPNLQILPQSRNLGVAAAYNLGLRQAQQRGAAWLWLLDQDSVCAAGCLQTLWQTATRLQAQGRPLAAVCPLADSLEFPDLAHPAYRWDGVALSPLAVPQGEALLAVDSSLTSGTLYSVAALLQIGGFREDYFIDFVDHECHLRLREAGLELWWEMRARLHHRLGQNRQRIAEGLWIEHAPRRCYFIARNTLRGLRRFGGWPAAWHSLRHELPVYLRRLFRHGRHPWRCAWNMMLGIVAGLGKK